MSAHTVYIPQKQADAKEQEQADAKEQEQADAKEQEQHTDTRPPAPLKGKWTRF
jgi:hypothetical protein